MSLLAQDPRRHAPASPTAGSPTHIHRNLQYKEIEIIRQEKKAETNATKTNRKYNQINQQLTTLLKEEGEGLDGERWHARTELIEEEGELAPWLQEHHCIGRRQGTRPPMPSSPTAGAMGG
jgi:hypothetical protein